MINKFKGHLKTVLIHKYYVLKNCVMAGIPIRGIVHDLSKFSPIEFFEGVKYYQGDRSPIDACKEINGYSKAWMHHKGRNKHHYQYWQDNFDYGGVPIQMPFEDALELVCDYLGAGMAYQKENFTYSKEYEWWKNKCSKGIKMHPQTKRFVEMMLYRMKQDKSNKILRKNSAKKIYNLAEKFTESDAKLKQEK